MPNPTAAMLTIGDEILSGRTRDTNMPHLARALAAAGIDLREARVVPDVADGDRRRGQRAARALRPRLHLGRHRPDPRRHHRRRDRRRLRRRHRRARGRPRDPRDQLRQPGDRPERRPAAHGAHPRRRDADRQPGVQGAGLHARQRPRHGRRAGGVRGDGRGPRAAPDRRRAAAQRDGARDARRRRARRAAAARSPRRIRRSRSAATRSTSDGVFGANVVLRGPRTPPRWRRPRRRLRGDDRRARRRRRAILRPATAGRNDPDPRRLHRGGAAAIVSARSRVFRVPPAPPPQPGETTAMAGLDLVNTAIFIGAAAGRARHLLEPDRDALRRAAAARLPRRRHARRARTGRAGIVFDNYRSPISSARSRSSVILFDGGLRTRLSVFRGVLAPVDAPRDGRRADHRGGRRGSRPGRCSTSTPVEALLLGVDRRLDRRGGGVLPAAHRRPAAAEPRRLDARDRERHQRPDRGLPRDRADRVHPRRARASELGPRGRRSAQQGGVGAATGVARRPRAGGACSTASRCRAACIRCSRSPARS